MTTFALIAVAALGAVVAVLIGVGLPVLDRYCTALAERRTGDALASVFGRPATVRIHGRPFLTQALRGRYESVRITGGGLRIGDMSGAVLDAQLHNVYVAPRDVLRRRVREVACERLEGELVLPYGELARVANVPGLELRPSRDRVVAIAALPVPGISQLARVSGRAVLTLGEGNIVWLRVRGVSVAGINLPSVVLNQLLPALEVPIDLPPLPWGLRIDEVRPAEDGLTVLGSAAAVVFRTPGVDEPAATADPDEDVVVVPVRPRPGNLTGRDSDPAG